jgi:hypothetical protein
VYIRSTSLSLIGLCLFSAQVLPQQVMWQNPDLRAKNLPEAQYLAIGRGHMSQCQVKASAAARQHYQTWQSQCPAGPVCGMMAVDKQREAEQMSRDMTVSCMAEKGWFLLPTERQ